jgi:hypothetical protein
MKASPSAPSETKIFSVEELRSVLLRAMPLPINQHLKLSYSKTLLLEIIREDQRLCLALRRGESDVRGIASAHLDVSREHSLLQEMVYLHSPTEDRRNGATLDLYDVEYTAPDERDSSHAVARDFLLKAQVCIAEYVADLESTRHCKLRKVTDERALVTRKMRQVMEIE